MTPSIKMRILKLAPHLSTEELKTVMNSQQSVRDFKDYQILYLVDIHKGKKAEEISSMLGITTNKVFKTVEKYNKFGVSWKEGISRGGRREARCIMTFDEEKSFLKTVEEDALSGRIVTYKHIRSKLEARLSKSVSDDYVWDLFRRHGWRKKVPCKSHPQSDGSAREEFKKNSPNYWLSNH
jgi:transposase